MRHALIAFAFVLNAPLSAGADEVPCDDAPYDQLDFWVGEWNAQWDVSDDQVGRGTNSITQDEYRNCVITERFESEILRGVSISAYDSQLGQWRQMWMDDNGGIYALLGGPGGPDDEFEFVLETVRHTDDVRRSRMIWQDVTADAFVWRWQTRDSDEEPWRDAWLIRYTRAPAQ